MMNGQLKSACTFNLLAAMLMAVATVPAIAGTLTISQVPATVFGQGNAQTGQFSLTVSNVGAGELSEVRLVSDHGHAVECGMQTVQGRDFAAQALSSGDGVLCTIHALAQPDLRNANVVVLARDTDGKRLQRSISLMRRPTGTLPQGIAVLAGGGIHADGNSDGLLQVGESINYDYTVLNLGSLALSALAATDLEGAVTCPQATLAVGASMVCTRAHPITGAEAGAGLVFNQIDISGVDANGDPVIAGDFVVTQNLGGDAGIRVFKSPLLFDDVDNSGIASAGDVLRYTFVIKNDNAQTLASVNLTEPDPSLIDTPILCNPTTLNGQPFGALGSAVLLSNDVELCQADHTITAADVSAGSADNLAEVTAQPGIGGPVQGTGASAVVIPATPAGAVVEVPANANWAMLVLLGLIVLVAGRASRFRSF